MEFTASTLGFLADMHQFHLDQARSYGDARITGLQTYIAAVAVLTAYAVSIAPRQGLTMMYRLLLSLATVLVLLFQMYWWFYIHVHNRWAVEYFNEIEEVGARAMQAVPQPKWPLTGTRCVGEDDMKVDLSWRNRKEREVVATWSTGFSEGSSISDAPQSAPPVGHAGQAAASFLERCPPPITWMSFWASWKHLNMWTLSLVIFFVLAWVFPARMFSRSIDKSPASRR